MPNTISAPLARDDKGKGVVNESSKIPTYNALNGKALAILLPNAQLKPLSFMERRKRIKRTI